MHADLFSNPPIWCVDYYKWNNFLFSISTGPSKFRFRRWYFKVPSSVPLVLWGKQSRTWCRKHWQNWWICYWEQLVKWFKILEICNSLTDCCQYWQTNKILFPGSPREEILIGKLIYEMSRAGNNQKKIRSRVSHVTDITWYRSYLFIIVDGTSMYNSTWFVAQWCRVNFAYPQQKIYNAQRFVS